MRENKNRLSSPLICLFFYFNISLLPSTLHQLAYQVCPTPDSYIIAELCSSDFRSISPTFTFLLLLTHYFYPVQNLYMKHCLLILFCWISLCTAHAQSESIPEFIQYNNSFLKYIIDTKDSAATVDSCLYAARALTTVKDGNKALQRLLHEALTLYFQGPAEPADRNSENYRRRAIGQVLLNKMVNDSNSILVNDIIPFYIWVRAQNNADNIPELKKLTTTFINTELTKPDLYSNKTIRYALLLHRIIRSKPAMTQLSEQLFNQTYEYLKNNQVTAFNDSSSGELLYKRAWHRYLFAYCNAWLGQKRIEINDIPAAGTYLQLAAEYSPDLVDKGHAAGYVYDLPLLGQNTDFLFTEDYIAYLKKYDHANKKAMLEVLKQSAIVDPEKKQRLKQYYNTHFAATESFDTYWGNATAPFLKKAPLFTLQLLNSQTFELSKKQGQWILLDFWGTWCGPCVREHPALEKFHKKAQTVYKNKIIITTLACNDTEERVRKYLQQKHYTFPVGMSGDDIQNLYHVKSYPTKILIDPQGSYIVVPFHADWVKFIEAYCDL